jgi:hypothetical protein
MGGPAYEPLRDRLLAIFDAGADRELDDERFDELARDSFAYQFERNAPYRAYCERRGLNPPAVRHWTAIPAVPTSAFKAVPLVCGEPSRAQAVFRTSGTTRGAGRRGEHYVPDLSLYHASLRAGFAAHLLPDGARLPLLCLVPHPSDTTDSSLSHMAGELADEFSAGDAVWAVGADGIRTEAALDTLRAAERTGSPLLVIGTSFAFVHLVDALAERGAAITLPHGSRVMDTGGFKGRSREMGREELYARIGAAIGVPPAWCVNEYGMTEMGSQFYDSRAGSPEAATLSARRYRAAGWVRTRAVDPETLELLPPGEVGILRHWDLANLGSVLALQTEDLGVCEPAGFRLLGRSRGAEPRGCSIAMDELLSALGR